MRRPYFLYATAIFISSFLLFQVQPLLGKHMLPWFGGSPAVWIVAMFFFMAALAAGYLYALVVSLLPKAAQLLVHVASTGAVAAVLFVHARTWPSPITPALGDFSFWGGEPAVQVCALLLVSIGAPFALLASSSSLLQHWYGAATGREPFSLYAVSNAGSLLGLLSYPLFFERYFSTNVQGMWWVYGFVFYVAALGLVMFHYAFRGSAPVSEGKNVRAALPSLGRFMWWATIAGIPVAVMLAGTSYITGYIAAVPFLWVVPLALYLVSFIVSFRSAQRLVPQWGVGLLTLLPALTALFLVSVSGVPAAVVLIATFAAMFGVFHICHEALYRNRPVVGSLTWFYLALSAGGIGASGALLGISLFLLPFPIELLLLLSGVSVFCTYRLLAREPEFRSFVPRAVRIAIATAVTVVLCCAVLQVHSHLEGVIAVERNFFGSKSVSDRSVGDGQMVRLLTHGVTHHGFQFEEGELRYEPVSYYSETSGVAAAFAYLRTQHPEGLRVAVGGLGAGTLAAHCEAGDRFEFFEIDPQVITLASTHFTYLDQCEGVSVSRGDARLLFAERAESGMAGAYDLVVIDVYADDMVPAHLLTTEALAIYQSVLAPGGIIAIHVSSRYLDLLPVVAGLGRAHALEVRQLHDRPEGVHAYPSIWTLLGDEAAFSDLAFERTTPIMAAPVLWTDRYSSLLPLLKW